ncbi:Phycoerythrobilin:ferredoxin oxidoreductase [Galdieria sulphuraria]|uniref:Phycoerythrobilin:ferredoxin oxidoreductase n=1 Tax=Galdieria sulphuraria TaxID=130081 RepID=M2X9Q0_GALSU|nr:phycoerythrobilin:ferredoxin oxidoreductase [Galdieria sulphuraria]EME26592.1 phycoerythrobilin:ferredoxin oxidoreductase [Galdieria sulphuraria]GJD07398.1 Phycoerythrobilin:ferredoxin oxidoreductase [Galdieria sulphuraria]|eukprot:XP_005703112.1 phycoerythrobilin:ferredoxin oxidoreductase [Galdieria sulphuraria]
MMKAGFQSQGYLNGGSFSPLKRNICCQHSNKYHTIRRTINTYQWIACSSHPTQPSSSHQETKDLYSPFFNKAIEILQSSISLQPYPIPAGFEEKVAITGKGSRQSTVKTTSYAYQSEKLRQIRAAHVQGGKALQVLNFVIFPRLEYDLPFFGADLVTLPGGHLIALDMQPLFHTIEYQNKYSLQLQPIYEKYSSLLPWGGDLPEDAKPFFSPCFLWSRPSQDEVIETHVWDAFQEYLELYLKFVNHAVHIQDKQLLELIKSRHLAYIQYRAEKDPARGMFTRFYGSEWTEEYIHGFLFDLPRKLSTFKEHYTC